MSSLSAAPFACGGAARPRQRPADDRDQLLQVERLRQVFVGAALGGADRGHEGVLRAHDDDRQLRPHPLDARQEVEGVLVRHHHVGDDEIALPLRDPAPEGRGVAGRAHLVAGARKRLVEHGPDGGVVVGEEDVSARHRLGLDVLSVPRPSRALYIGRSTRKVVRRGAGSHSTIPPWSPTIFATKASPRPLPWALVVTNGSNRSGRRSSGTPGPLSRTVSSIGRLTRSREPGTCRRMPGAEGGRRARSRRSRASMPIASAAFFTRLRKTWTSWSRLPRTGGSDGS